MRIWLVALLVLLGVASTFGDVTTAAPEPVAEGGNDPPEPVADPPEPVAEGGNDSPGAEGGNDAPAVGTEATAVESEGDASAPKADAEGEGEKPEPDGEVEKTEDDGVQGTPKPEGDSKDAGQAEPTKGADNGGSSIAASISTLLTLITHFLAL